MLSILAVKILMKDYKFIYSRIYIIEHMKLCILVRYVENVDLFNISFEKEFVVKEVHL